MLNEPPEVWQEMSSEYSELESGMIREFTIHILQSINFLQNMEPVDASEIASREIDLPLKKKHKGIHHLLLFDLDETLAHCVRAEDNASRPPDVVL